MQSKLAESPHHSILDKSWKYDVMKIEFSWKILKENWIDFELSSQFKYVGLRFTSISHVFIPAGDTITTIGMVILDTSEFLPEMPGPIYVHSGNGLEFWAQDVKKLMDVDSQN
ncbi:MAG: hypothetical protein OER96_12200 [Gammaproteobacteria bacterium]|nr:hypothetical protein [Gammaproteobacteria bacterium]